MGTQLEQTTLDRTALQSAVDAVHHAGVPGVQAEVRAGDELWRGIAGVADLDTGRPVELDLRQRVGSITKTFTAAAVLLVATQGRLGLDDPIGHHLPHLVPGDLGAAVTVRMLLNHTSGFAEYLPHAYPSFRAYPSLRDITPDSIDDNRHRRFHPTELIELGLAAPATGAPGGRPGVYSNTNYLLLGQLLEQVTGMPAEEYITRNVIEHAGLTDTWFPTGPEIDAPHWRMYEALFGLIDPPRDYSVFDMSWVGPAAGLVSTVADVNRFFTRLFAGELVDRASLAQMLRTVPVIAQDGHRIEYGLGLHRFDLPGRGEVWGNDGSVWGALTASRISADGTRQVTVAINHVRWNQLDAAGRPQPHPIDHALDALYRLALG
jgi:D-alanyl-D-alanine carboxypeptidase